MKNKTLVRRIITGGWVLLEQQATSGSEERAAELATQQSQQVCLHRGLFWNDIYGSVKWVCVRVCVRVCTFSSLLRTPIKEQCVLKTKQSRHKRWSPNIWRLVWIQYNCCSFQEQPPSLARCVTHEMKPFCSKREVKVYLGSKSTPPHQFPPVDSALVLSILLRASSTTSSLAPLSLSYLQQSSALCLHCFPSSTTLGSVFFASNCN